MQPTIGNLIQPLIRATMNGNIKWEPDPSGGYLARFGSNVVNVYAETYLGLRVVSANGTVVDWLDNDELDARHVEVRELFELADRQFRDVDHILKDILRQLGEDAAVAH